jgi:hypothetical protein
VQLTHRKEFFDDFIMVIMMAKRTKKDESREKNVTLEARKSFFFPKKTKCHLPKRGCLRQRRLET